MRNFLLASIAIAVLAVSAPDLIKRYVAQTGGPESPETPSLAVATKTPGARPAHARQVVIKAERNGHFYVDAEINFRPVRMMVDTGATVIALRQSDAATLGIRPRASDFDQPVATANGTAYAAGTQLDNVVVRDIEVSGVRALILPDEQLNVSLLGASFLNRLARFQVEGGTLMFEN
jgi:aspartyl protease family protein